MNFPALTPAKLSKAQNGTSHRLGQPSFETYHVNFDLLADEKFQTVSSDRCRKVLPVEQGGGFFLRCRIDCQRRRDEWVTLFVLNFLVVALFGCFIVFGDM